MQILDGLQCPKYQTPLKIHVSNLCDTVNPTKSKVCCTGVFLVVQGRIGVVL